MFIIISSLIAAADAIILTWAKFAIWQFATLLPFLKVYHKNRYLLVLFVVSNKMEGFDVGF